MFDYRSCMDHCTIKNILPTDICSTTLHCKFEKSRLFIHISHTFLSNFWFVVCIDHCTVVNNSRIEIGSKTVQVQFKMCRLSLQLKFLSRDVAKKKFSRLRYPLSRVTLEGAFAFCVGAGGGPLPLGGGAGGPPPGNFENLSSIWCPLVQSGDSLNAVNIH